MRNTVLMLMGSELEASAPKLMQYALQYGEVAVTDYLQVATWLPAGPSGIKAALCQRVEKSETEFCSDLSDEYRVAVGEGQQLTSDEEVMAWWSSVFVRTVTLQHQGESSGLHVCLVVKLWDKPMVDEALRVARCLKGLSHTFVVDVLGVPPSLAPIFDETISTSAQLSNERKATAQACVRQLVEAKKTDRIVHALIMFEGVNTQGVALNMDYDIWMRVVGEYVLIAVENYLSLFPHNANLQESDCTTFGISILNFDKFYFIHYLLRRAYLKILGREKVQQHEVDINKVAAIAQDQLERHHHRFSHLYENEVKPMLAQGMNEKDILARITERVEQETDEMVFDFQSFIDSEEISLPEKQATLAQLLGLNDELYVGNLFARDQLVFEDCGSDAIDTFVHEDNKLGNEGVLTTPKDKETGLVFSPIAQLKDLRLRIMESDRYIRSKTAELEQWQTQITETAESEKRLTTDGFVYGNVTYRFMADEEVKLFEETYQPKDVTTDSVDMRPLFTAVRNQGELGACSVFAMVGVYEFLLKKLGKSKTDLSEHFVYYNVSVDSDGRTQDNGSSFFDVAQSMSDKGICIEELCRYNGTLEKPSAEAYEEATNHLIKKVKNIEIGASTADNHKAITSALAEGYPVIVSLKLYDSFGTGIKGFVSRPTPDERQREEHGNHAMVICGFSNEEKVYIVRNSWGAGFGDHGYCYIPYSYIDDAAFCNQACIITQIAESDSLGGFDKNVVRKVSFSTTDATIRYAIARNQIDEETLRLTAQQIEYQALASDYYKLTSELDNNGVRRQILSGAENRLNETIKQKKEELDQFLKEEYMNALQNVKAETKSGMVLIGSIIAAWLLVLTVFLSYDDLHNWVSEDFWKTMGGIGVILAIAFAWYRYYRNSVYNETERNLNKRRDHMAMEVRDFEKELAAKHLKLHIAGMFVESVNKAQHILDHKYKLLKGYVGNLSQWMEDEQKGIEQMTVEEKVPFIPIIRNKDLDRFFAEREDEITAPVRLYKFLDKVGLSDDDIVAYKYNVRNSIAEVLQMQYADFSMLDYVLAKKPYVYLPQKTADVADLMGRLNAQSDSFLQLSTTGQLEEGLISRYVMTAVRTEAERQRWMSEYPRHFQQRPSDVATFVSPFKLVELQVRHLQGGQIEWLR